MNPNELYYKKVMGAIGTAMLLFLALLNAYGFGITFVDLFLSMLPIPEVAVTVIYELLYGAGYMACFMIPAAFLNGILKKRGCVVHPMYLAPRLSPYLPLMIFAGVTVCFSAAQINAALVSVFDYSEFSSEVLWGDAQAPKSYELVLQFITTCVVPGFCEEFLFRGAILTNCLPFGRSKAIFISAFLFAMMHQNAEQLLYTFAAGIVLGLIYEYTGSIWNCTILHILNNFVSLAENAAFYGAADTVGGNLAIFVIEAVIYTLGAISIAILILRFCSEKKDLRTGVFGVDVSADHAWATCPVEGKRAVKLFLRPTMVVFLAFSVLQIVLLILMAVVMV